MNKNKGGFSNENHCNKELRRYEQKSSKYYFRTDYQQTKLRTGSCYRFHSYRNLRQSD